ncbi:MAG: hypothetical protein LBJ14_01250 [Desulfarculales bacterium]|nr:hypothetical protein [Desulfarculales bacterium]
MNKSGPNLKLFLYVLLLQFMWPGPALPSQSPTVYLQLSNGLELSLPAQWQTNGPKGPLILEACHWLDDETPGLRLLIYRRSPLPLLSSRQLEMIQASRDEFTDRLRAMLEAGRGTETEAGRPAIDSWQGCRSWFQGDLFMVGVAYSWRQNGRLWQGESIWILSVRGNYCLAFYWREGMGDYYAPLIRQALASVRLREEQS